MLGSDTEGYLRGIFARPGRGKPGLSAVITPQPRHTRCDRHELAELTYRDAKGDPVALARFIRYVDMTRRSAPPPETDPAKPDYTLDRNWMRMIDIGRRDNRPEALRGIMTVIAQVAQMARSTGAIVFTESQELATILRQRFKIPLAPSEFTRNALFAQRLAQVSAAIAAEKAAKASSSS